MRIGTSFKNLAASAAIGLGALGIAGPAKADGDGRPPITQKERQRQILDQEIIEAKQEIDRLRKLGVPEAELQRKAEILSEDFARKIVGLENGDSRKIDPLLLLSLMALGLAGFAVSVKVILNIEENKSSKKEQFKTEAQESTGEYQI
ncbi:MAG: hypothetical protein HY094_04825 [Candidatus Melainabacteria bacterium]|nr:hypothetical protein [Candidatus Melainabacteria bacterium]